jgi:TonB-dependent receptor
MRAYLLAGCGLLALAVRCPSAAAQPPAPAGATDLGRVGTTEGAPAGAVAPSSVGDRAQAKEQKKEAPNVIEVQPYTEIEKLPEQNLAEALQRVPGVSLESDSGRGRFINIRGIDADQIGTLYDGVVLTPSNQASPLGGGRAFAFDAIPPGVIGGIEVIKSLTPDIDATGLGGTVNLLPRALPPDGQPFLDADLNLGWEALRRTAEIQGYVTAGTAFGLDGDGMPWDQTNGDRPFSIIGTFSRYDYDRGIDDVEESYSDTTGVPNKALQNLQLRRYSAYHDEAQGGAVQLGYKPNDLNNFYLRVLDSGYEEQVDKHFLVFTGIDGQTNITAPDGTILVPGQLITLPDGTFQSNNATAHQQFTNDDEDVESRTFVLGGHSIVGGSVKLDYRASWSRGTDDFTFADSSDFTIQNPINVAYNNTNPNAITVRPIGVNTTNPALFLLNSVNSTPSQSYDQEFAFAIDATVPVQAFSYDGEAKFGLSARFRSRGDSMNQTSLVPTGTTNLGSLVSGPDDIYYTGLYNLGPNIVNSALNAAGLVPKFFGGVSLFNGALTTGFNNQENTDFLNNEEAFSHDDENVFAGYGEYTVSAGKLGLLGGLRIEGTEATYKANVGSTFQQFDAAGQPVLDQNNNPVFLTSITPTTSTTSYVDFFPSLQAKYNIADDLLARAAFSTAIARPGFNQISAAKTIDFSNGTISQGNPALQPTTDYNFDLSLEYYLPNGGILSAGAFDKEYENYIVPTTVTVTNVPGGTAGQTFLETSFKNIAGSEVQGLEFQYTQQFLFLPEPFNGLGFDSNFTYNHSRGEIRPGEFETLPSTSPLNFNAAVFYEEGPITARLASSYVSRNLFAVGPDRNTDIFSSPRFRLDLQTSYQLTKNLAASFAIHNITNTKLEFTESDVSSRPIQREFYDSDYLFGLHLKF